MKLSEPRPCANIITEISLVAYSFSKLFPFYVIVFF
jgi:hypothetical protein